MDCPVHALWDQLLLLRRRFPHCWSAEQGFSDTLPLFPTTTGAVVQKEAAVATIHWAARQLGVALQAPDGSERVAGHSLRVTGAQGLAARGWHLWTVQLLGRWGSEAVKGYFREAPLQALTRSPATEGAHIEMDDLVQQLVSRLRIHSLTEANVVVPEPNALPEARRLTLEAAEQQVCTGDADLVVNDASGVTHAQATSGRARCGWAYNRRPHTCLPGPPSSNHILCANCFHGLEVSDSE